MPLFDPNNTVSDEAEVLWNLADLLAECEAAQRLAEKTTGTAGERKIATRAKIIVGPHAGPWGGDAFTPDEMASRFIEFQLALPTESGRTLVKSGGSFDRPDVTSDVWMYVRRHARASELSDRSDLYLWFLDQMAALENELMVKSEQRECPVLQAIVRQQIGYGALKKKSAQGEFLHTLHTITWGDPISD